MAKGLFFNMPLHGHVHPTLPVVQDLRAVDEIIQISQPLPNTI